MLEACWNRTFVKFFLNSAQDDYCLSNSGRLFHRSGAEYLKDFAAKVSCLILFVTKVGPLLLDLMFCHLFYLSCVKK